MPVLSLNGKVPHPPLCSSSECISPEQSQPLFHSRFRGWLGGGSQYCGQRWEGMLRLPRPKSCCSRSKATAFKFSSAQAGLFCFQLQTWMSSFWLSHQPGCFHLELCCGHVFFWWNRLCAVWTFPSLCLTNLNFSGWNEAAKDSQESLLQHCDF